MTIKLPVRVVSLSRGGLGYYPFYIDDDGNGREVAVSELVEALNATATPAPDLTALEQAVDTYRVCFARQCATRPGSEDRDAARRTMHSAREDIVAVAFTMFPAKDALP